MLTIPQMILVGSANRNHGKTTLACALIQELRKTAPVIGLKVIAIDQLNGKCQRNEEGCGLCALVDQPFELIQEFQEHIEKDTSLMLQAGAQKAYLLKSLKSSMDDAMHHFLNVVPPNTFIVCESNSLRRFVKPGIFLFAKREDNQQLKTSAQMVIHDAARIIDPYQAMDLSGIHVIKTSKGLFTYWEEDGEKGAITCL